MEHLFFKRTGIRSAEQKHIIDPESGYFQAVEFAHDPIGVITELRIDCVENDQLSGFDLVQQVISCIEESKDIIKAEKITSEHKLVVAILKCEYESQEWAAAVFEMLKQTSFSISEIEEWIIGVGVALSAADAAQEQRRQKKLLVELHKVYEE